MRYFVSAKLKRQFFHKIELASL